MTVGENIRKYRKEQGLTQKELAYLSGLNEVTIRSYETEKYKPKLKTLQQISKALGVYIGNFVEDWNEYSEEAQNEDPFDFAISLEDFQKGLIRKTEHEENILLENYKKLNSKGRTEAQKRVQELTELPRYTEIEEAPLE